MRIGVLLIQCINVLLQPLIRHIYNHVKFLKTPKRELEYILCNKKSTINLSKQETRNKARNVTVVYITFIC